VHVERNKVVKFRMNCVGDDGLIAGLKGDAENARLENAGLEISAPNCRGGKCRTGIIGTI